MPWLIWHTQNSILRELLNFRSIFWATVINSSRARYDEIFNTQSKGEGFTLGVPLFRGSETFRRIDKHFGKSASISGNWQTEKTLKL